MREEPLSAEDDYREDGGRWRLVTASQALLAADQAPGLGRLLHQLCLICCKIVFTVAVNVTVNV